jgi:hypothetical protein
LEAKKITQKWSSLPELQSIINALKSKNYSAFVETDNYLKEFIIELKKTPSNSKEHPILLLKSYKKAPGSWFLVLSDS